ncbi:MAG: fibronectin type III domain-containing protein [Bacteroidetes bacterium]|nr:fibronectin type III domain-containing protein [Bacteroidota bacterium]
MKSSLQGSIAKLRLSIGTLFTMVSIASQPLQTIAQTAMTENSPGITARSLYEFEKIKDPSTGQIPLNAQWQALLETKQAAEFYMNTSARSTALSWIERGPNTDVVGPSNGNTRANSAVTAGRMRSILVDASDATGKTVWVGGVDGGLWKTTDITVSPANWMVINDYLSNLAVSDICQDPTNPDIMYFCTGESYANADAVAGVGVFKSIDHGVTWSQLTNTSAYTRCTRILCDYQGNVYLGTRSTGLLRSNDGGATWVVITPSGMNSSICDMEISSTSAAGRLHVVSGIFSTQSYRYTDLPSSATTASGWNAPATGFPSYAMRAEIACSGNVLYACPADASYQVPTIYKSTDGGVNWASTGGQPTSGWASGQGWYSLAVGIDPSNSDICIVGGLDNYKTTNGGTSWTKISNWVGTTGQYVHADMHDITWYDNGNKLLFGCDGGIHYSADKGTTIRDRNIGLRIKQFYSVAVHPTSTDYFLAGAQDNGTHKLTAAGLGGSVEVTGGDGAFVAIDQDQPQYQFGAYVYNQYRRSTDGGNSWSSVNFSSSAGNFINQFDYDNTNNKLYASHNAGSYLRWDNPQTGSTTAIISVSNFNASQVSAIKVSPFTANRVFFGTEGGRIVRVDNANLAAPSSVNLTSASMPAGNVSCVNTGTSDQYLMACYSNYGVTNIWISSDAGATWTGIDGNLPNMPVRWCMFEPNDNTRGIIATETGVWETSLFDGANTIWIPSLNFPSVRTDMLQYRASDGLLAAATHGRGIFSTVVTNSTVCNNPAGLSTSAITSTGATLNWSASAGALSYNVDYRINGGISWTNAATATTNTSVNISGLNASTLYEWQVNANCASGNSAYSVAQFTSSAPPSCNAPSGLNSTNITPTSATLNWSAVSGAIHYDVDYKLNSSSTWINAATATTSTSVNVSGLANASTYDWQVRSNCTSLSSTYTAAQFTTTTPSVCPGSLDVSTNGTSSGAATIPFNTDVYGLINPASDNDFYKFVITTGGSATITLSDLPANYDIYLYSSNGTTLLASSKRKNLNSETISRTYTAGTYYIKVRSAGTGFSASLCYTLRVQLGTASTQDMLIPMYNENSIVKLYPNPVTDMLHISTSIELDANSYFKIYDANGRVLITDKFVINPQSIDVSKLIPGLYLISVKTAEGEATYKFIRN